MKEVGSSRVIIWEQIWVICEGGYKISGMQIKLDSYLWKLVTEQ